MTAPCTRTPSGAPPRATTAAVDEHARANKGPVPDEPSMLGPVAPTADVARGRLSSSDVTVGNSGSPPSNRGTGAQLESKRSPAGELLALLDRPSHPQDA